MSCLRLALLLLLTLKVLAQEPLASCLSSRYDYIVSKNPQQKARCSPCNCDGTGCHTQCGDSCEICNDETSSCLVYTEQKHFYRASTEVDSCLQATAGLDADRTLCGGILLTNKKDDMTLDGIPCHAPRFCGASKLDPRTVYDCRNVDGESFVNECEEIYEGFLGRVWQRYGSESEYKSVGRCIFNEAAVVVSSEAGDIDSDDEGNANDNNDGLNGLGMGAVVGIVVGVCVAATLVSLAFYYRSISRDKNTTATQSRSSVADPEEQKSEIETGACEETDNQNSESSVESARP